MTLHTKCWKFYEARPRETYKSYKGEFSAYVEGFDVYLYSMKWVKFLRGELKDDGKLAQVKMQAI
jgi:hypothetical protein